MGSLCIEASMLTVWNGYAASMRCRSSDNTPHDALFRSGMVVFDHRARAEFSTPAAKQIPQGMQQNRPW